MTSRFVTVGLALTLTLASGEASAAFEGARGLAAGDEIERIVNRHSGNALALREAMRGQLQSAGANGSIDSASADTIGSSVARSVTNRPSPMSVRSIDVEALSHGFGGAPAGGQAVGERAVAFMQGFSAQIVQSGADDETAAQTLVGSAASGLMLGAAENAAGDGFDDDAAARLAEAVGHGVLAGVGEAGGSEGMAIRLVNAGMVGAAVGHLAASGQIDRSAIQGDDFAAVVGDLNNVAQIEPGAGPQPSLMQRIRQRFAAIHTALRQRGNRTSFWRRMRERSQFGTVSPN